MGNMSDYLLQYKRKLPNILLLWLLMGVFILAFILFMNDKFKLIDYYQIKGIGKDDYLSILVPVDNIEIIGSNNKLYIGKDKYNYRIEKISEVVQEGTLFYQNVVLDVDLKNKNFIDNNVVELKFVIQEKTILKYIFNLVKGEFWC